MDESGHDHRNLPYEVRGGICIDVGQVWEFTARMKQLETSCFGDCLSNYGSEIKGTKLLEKKRFTWAAGGPPVDPTERRKLSRGFLARTAKGQDAPKEMWWAYGQSSLEMAKGIVRLAQVMKCKVFASLVPKGRAVKPAEIPDDYVRKDLAFLFERYFYFLDERGSNGLLVLDETNRTDDRRYLKRIERYFASHEMGKEHAKRILPSPLFIGSEMSYPIQAADVLIYMIATAYRPRGSNMNAESRADVVGLVGKLLPSLAFKTVRSRGSAATFQSESVFLIDEPWSKK